MNNFQIKTPIALLLFNRPEMTKRVLSAIRIVKPRQLFIIGDGPRHNRMDDKVLVFQTRKIAEKIDWSCEVRTNLSEINLGCRKRISTGIDWVFENVEEAIFLEDDCLPDPSFFRFCEELLQLYKSDKSVGMISGSQLLTPDLISGTNSYFFTRFCPIWGWATWKDRWVDTYDVNMSQWEKIKKDKKEMISLLGNKGSTSTWKDIFNLVSSGKIDTWDYQWLFANWVNKRVSIVPAKNLVSNIGFGITATHTKKITRFADIRAEKMIFPMIHPLQVFIDENVERNTYNYLYKPSLLGIFKQYIILFIRNLFSLFKLPHR